MAWGLLSFLNLYIDVVFFFLAKSGEFSAIIFSKTVCVLFCFISNSYDMTFRDFLVS